LVNRGNWTWGSEQTESWLLGTEIDEVLQGNDCIDIIEPRKAWPPILPSLKGKEREAAAADVLGDAISEPDHREYDAAERRADEQWRHEQQGRLRCDRASVAPPAPAAPSFSIVPAPDVIGPRIDCRPVAAGWLATCSQCGALGFVIDPYSGALHHLNSQHAIGRAA
jgi:hypothetical protein